MEDKRFDLEGQEFKNDKGYYYQMEEWPKIVLNEMDPLSTYTISNIHGENENWTSTYATPAGALIGVAKWVKKYKSDER